MNGPNAKYFAKEEIYISNSFIVRSYNFISLGYLLTWASYLLSPHIDFSTFYHIYYDNPITQIISVDILNIYNGST